MVRSTSRLQIRISTGLDIEQVLGDKRGMNATLGQSSFPTALLSLDSSIPLVLSPPGSQQPKMSELNNIIANYSHVLENSHATLRACEEFERDRARIENLIPLRVHRNRTEYSTLSAEDLVKHKESLLEGIFDDHVFGQVRSKLSYEASEVKTVAFLGDPRVTGVTLYLPKPIVKLVDTEEDNDYETARTYHHDIIDQTLETHLFNQAEVSQTSADYPYSFLGDTVVNLVGLLTTKMRMLASVVSAKETFVASAL